MKRRYKEGDWIHVPLGAHADAIGIISRACRSRLFGYFFAWPAEALPTHGDLKRLGFADAAACALFGGAPIEELRWKVIATSVPFDRRAWPFPQFVSRGAFGRVWMRRTYDPETMAICATETIDEAEASGLPDARFAVAGELEAFLRERICGTAPREPLAVYELHEGSDAASMQILSRGGRVQFSEPLSAAQLQTIARFITRHPDIELRVHGFSTQPFDVRSLVQFECLRALILDARLVENLDALSALRQLQRLRIATFDPAQRLHALAGLTALRNLEVQGPHADVDLLANCAQLESLTLIDTPAVRLEKLASASGLRRLTLAHAAHSLDNIGALVRLTQLELRDMSLNGLPDLSSNVHLETVILRNVRGLYDLAPLVTAPVLNELEICGSPQLNVEHFKPLAACSNLRRLHVDVGSRRKAREVYRLLHVGRREHG